MLAGWSARAHLVALQRVSAGTRAVHASVRVAAKKKKDSQPPHAHSPNRRTAKASGTPPPAAGPPSSDSAPPKLKTKKAAKGERKGKRSGLRGPQGKLHVGDLPEPQPKAGPKPDAPSVTEPAPAPQTPRVPVPVAPSRNSVRPTTLLRGEEAQKARIVRFEDFEGTRKPKGVRFGVLGASDVRVEGTF